MSDKQKATSDSPAPPARFPSPEARAKRAELLRLLDDGFVSIFVDVEGAGVDIPQPVRERAMRGKIHLTHLHLSRAFNLPVFEVGMHEIRAALSFGSDRYLCVIPWASVLMMRPGQ